MGSLILKMLICEFKPNNSKIHVVNLSPSKFAKYSGIHFCPLCGLELIAVFLPLEPLFDDATTRASFRPFQEAKTRAYFSKRGQLVQSRANYFKKVTNLFLASRAENEKIFDLPLQLASDRIFLNFVFFLV